MKVSDEVDRVPVHPLPITDSLPPRAPVCARPGAAPGPTAGSESACCRRAIGCWLAGFRAPADEAVAAAQMARRRTPRHAGDRSPLRPHQILQMLAHRLLVAQVVWCSMRLLNSGSSAVRRTCRTSAAAQLIQRRSAVSCRREPERAVARRRSDCGHQSGPRGSSISPARCSISIRPRHTMSHKAPLACFHCHASHTFADSLLRLRPECWAMNWRRKRCLPV